METVDEAMAIMERHQQWTSSSVLMNDGGTLPLTEPLPARQSHMPDPLAVGRE